MKNKHMFWSKVMKTYPRTSIINHANFGVALLFVLTKAKA